MPYEAESYKMRSSCDSCHNGDVKAEYSETFVQRQRETQLRNI